VFQCRHLQTAAVASEDVVFAEVDSSEISRLQYLSDSPWNRGPHRAQEEESGQPFSCALETARETVEEW